MSWLLPAPLLPIAGVLALLLVWPRFRQQPSTVRLAVEAIAVTIGAVGILWAAWLVLWWAEQRW